MKLDLVSHTLCPFVHRVATLLSEKQVPFGIRYIDLRNKPDWFLALSPRGRVPVLVADGQPLFESAAILEFVDETQGTPRLPADPFERARQRAYVAFASDVFTAQYKYLTASSDADFEAAAEQLRGQLGAFEQALAQTQGDAPFFAGGQLGLVDVAIAPALLRVVVVDRLLGTDVLGALPRVRAWAHRLAAHPSVIAGLPPDFDRLSVDSLRAANGAIARRLPA